MKESLSYVLHSAQLFGTERMALATLLALNDQFESCILAPQGPLHAECARRGVAARASSNRAQMAWQMVQRLCRQRQGALFSTGVWQALLAESLRMLGLWRGPHLHLVHGGTSERLSYGRKRCLAHLPLRLVAVSDFVRERLVAHGVPADQIAVVPNFLVEPAPVRRPPFERDGVRRVVMLSRLDRIKRVGLLLDALERQPGLQAMQFDVYGSGEESAALARRAAALPNLRLHGFSAAATQALAGADLLLHTCPEEPFGLVLLEAFAAGVPVLVPNSGGAAGIVQDGINGCHFSANDATALGQRLLALQAAPAKQLNAWVEQGRRALQEAYSQSVQTARYAALARGLS